MKVILTSVLDECEKIRKNLQTVNTEDLQECILIAAQVLMPPIRGKPFYSLELVDTGANSMCRD